MQYGNIPLFFPSAPSAPPTNVSTLNVTSSTIIIQWGKVNCKNQNGLIIGYSVKYGIQGNINTTMNISGGSASMTTISNLLVSTTYEIEVAAVNSAGVGVFSPVILADTKPSECSLIYIYTIVSLNLHSKSIHIC